MWDRGTFLGEIWIARASLAEAVWITVASSLITIAIGFVAGIILGTALAFGPAPVRWLVRLYIDLVRGIPVLVLILFTFYGLSLAGVNVAQFWAGVIALSVFCTAHMAETVRGAIGSVPQAQIEAAKSIGLRFFGRLFHVVLPLAIRRVLPPSVNTMAEIVKGTTLLSIIGVVELLLAVQQAVARNYLVLEFYGAALLLYVGFNFCLSQIAAYFERRFAYLRY